jgi:hypothetical protein
LLTFRRSGQALAVSSQEWGLRSHGKFFDKPGLDNACAYSDFNMIFKRFEVPEGIPHVDH